MAFIYAGDDLPHYTAFEVALIMKSMNILKMIAFHEHSSKYKVASDF